MTEKERLQREITEAKVQLSALAIRRYGVRFDNNLYTKATISKGTVYANALIDEALAFCGHPWYKFSNRRWSIAALVFLSKFTE